MGIPTNSWMNNPQYLAQVGHTLGGAAIVLLTGIFFGVSPACWIVWLAILVAAGVKEFWYDANYELPKQTWQDNVMDFSFYQVGAGMATLLCYLAHHLGRLR